MFGLGEALGAASALGGLFGDDNEGAAPQQSNHYTGYNALPEQGRKVYDSYFQMLQALANNPYAQQRMGMAGKPNDMYGSQELYNLQQTQPGQGVRPIGVLEPFNQVQKGALGAYAQPDYTNEGLAQYLQPFQGARDRALENINRDANIGYSGIKGAQAMNGSLARDPMYGGQVPQLEEARARAIADMEAGFNQQALGLRGQSLSDMLNSGNLIQKQNQAGLTAASGQNLAMSNPAYGQAQAYMQLLQGMPQASSSQSMGDIAGRPDMLSKISGFGQGMFGNKLGDLFGNSSGAGAARGGSNQFSQQGNKFNGIYG